ncbi:MAG: hypothetical protein ACUZ8N_06390 [Candidatus Scalindua sp.]
MAANYLLVSVIYNKSGLPPAVGKKNPVASRLSPEDAPVGSFKIRPWRSCLRQIRRGGEAESTYTL